MDANWTLYPNPRLIFWCFLMVNTLFVLQKQQKTNKKNPDNNKTQKQNLETIYKSSLDFLP